MDTLRSESWTSVTDLITGRSVADIFEIISLEVETSLIYDEFAADKISLFISRSNLYLLTQTRLLIASCPQRS